MSLRPYLLLALLFVLPATAVAGDPAAGRGLFTGCTLCHGTQAGGIAAMNAPGLAGQSEAYLVRQLQNFRSGVRGTAPGDMFGAQMRPMVAALSNDAMIANVAAYLASLPETTQPATITGDAEAGSKQYTGKCGACHGGKGEGNDALNAPRLTGLGDAYLVRQVQNFRNGLRGAHADDEFGQQMKMMAATVSDAELKDIVAFLNAQAE